MKTEEMDMEIRHIKTSYGEVDIEVPRDRDASFEPEIIPKRQKDVSAIENKVLAMYAKKECHNEIYLLQLRIFMVSRYLTGNNSTQILQIQYCLK